MLPPRWARRLVLIPLAFVLAVLAVLTLPVTASVAGVLALLRPRARGRLPRVLLVIVGYFVAEVVALLALGWLWLIAGFGRSIRTPVNERRHYVLVRTFLQFVYLMVQHILHVQVTVEGPAPEAYLDRPLIVFCRHAGPGDSFLIVHALLDWYDREPRIVLKDTLQWDPAIDIVLNRLPNRFIRGASPGLPAIKQPHQPQHDQQGRPDQPDQRGRPDQPGRPGRQSGDEQAIGELSRRLDHNDALVLFPEGGNFTSRRRARAIQRLRRKGLLAEAEKAEAMRHVLPPRPGGVLAVLENAHEADVVWVAHTGTDHLLSVADVWAALPMDIEILMRWWLVPSGAVPTDPEAQIAWLYAWWKEIDQWIATHRLTR